MQMNCPFCGKAGSSLQKNREGKDIFRLQCEKCGTVDCTETAYTTKLGTLTADDKSLLAKYLHDNSGRVHQITDGNFYEIPDRQRAKSDGERLRAELHKKR
jgi:transcription elongation factor Elf1